MVIRDSKLIISATNPSQYPDDDKVCIALCGRSNVGKSSLINSLLGRKSLARVSSSPGKTRTINFYLINGEFYLVDLPGYGYAKMSKTEKEKWSNVMEDFFNNSKNLKTLFLLLDIRHEPKELDLQMYNYSSFHDIETRIIATKSDKIKRGQYQKSYKVIRDKLGLDAGVKIYPHSSLKREGTTDILEMIEEIVSIG